MPYAKVGNPQTLNLYGYVGNNRNNPLSAVDPDGHQNTPGGTQCGQTVSIACNNLGEDGPAGEAAAELNAAEAHYAAQIQQPSSNSSSNGPGFWSRVGSHLGNLFHGHSWNHGTRESVTVKILPADPIPGVTAATDAAGLLGTWLRM